MTFLKGIAMGFVAGFAVAAGAILLRGSGEGAGLAADSAHLAQIDERILRLERALSQLSGLVATVESKSIATSPERVSAAAASVDTARFDARQAQAIASAESMVDRAVNSGQWTRAQASELNAAIADLDREEQGRILARISAAINEDRLQVELP